MQLLIRVVRSSQHLVHAPNGPTNINGDATNLKRHMIADTPIQLRDSTTVKDLLFGGKLSSHSMKK